MESFNVQINNINKIIDRLRKEKVFSISFLLAVFTSFFIQPQISYINFKVLILLFNLMIVVSAFEKLKVMDKIALSIIKKCKDTRMLSLVFIVVTFFASMLVTNDVALITFVPLSMITFKKVQGDCMKTIILQTLAANIGSSLTPMGNPQNLFLFTHYNLSGIQFFSVTIPFVFLGIIWLFLLNNRVLKSELNLNLNVVNIRDVKKASLYTALFVIIIFSVFGLIDYRYVFIITLLFTTFMDKYLIKQVDYFLLATFICFFIFIGNVSNIDFIQSYLQVFLQNPSKTYFSSIILSQIVSNVPCSILVSSFTNNWREVLLGVNIGGLGTLIASLASLISYKLYINDSETQEEELYLKKFNIYNFVSLFLFTILNYLYIHYFI